MPRPPPAALPADPACLPFRLPALPCADAAAGPSELSSALALDAALERSQALAALEQCERYPAAALLALRAESAPPGCADVVIGDSLDPNVGAELAELLTALVVAAHLRRLVVEAPRLTAPFSKQDFAEYSKSVLNDWVVAQAQAIYKIAQSGAQMSGAARAIVAVEAGLADMRFVEVVREVPLPEEMAHDDELKEIYYSELDVALAPWKDRGRDAALVGLKEFARLGVLDDQRVDRARQLLSRLYGGRRIDRLDGLMLPALAAAVPPDATARLAGQLPTYLVPVVLPELDPHAPGVLRQLLERGLPPAARADLESRSLPQGEALLVAQALVRLGQLYFGADDFASAQRVLERAEGAPGGEEAQLLHGVALALKHGPRDVVEMMQRGLRAYPLEVSRLDRLAQQGGPWAGAAAFDAAYLLELAPPASDPAFWRQIAGRYTAAAGLLAGPADRARAVDAARAAAQTGDAVGPKSR